MLNGADEIGGGKGVVHHQGQLIPVGQGGQGIQIGDIAVGITQSFHIDSPSIGLDGLLHLGEIVNIDKGGGDAQLGQSVGHQVIAAAVDGLLGHDVPAALGQRLKSIGDGGGAGGQGQSGRPSFQSSYTPFQDLLRGVSESAVDVSRFL